MAHAEDSKVDRLALELADVRTDRGLSDPGRLSECPLLIETAGKICHPNGDKGEPLLDAMRVLIDAVAELPEHDILIFNTVYAIGRGNWAPKLGTRRSDLGAHFGRDAKTIYRWEKPILRKVAYKIVEREEQIKTAETESQLAGHKPTRLPDISVDSIEATVVLDDDGRIISRKTSFALRPLRPLTSSAGVMEFSDDEFEISEAVNCTAHDVSQVKRSVLQILDRAKERGIDDSEIQELQGMLGRIEEYQRKSSEIPGGLGLSHTQAIGLPSMKIGEPFTLSYSTSYRRPKSESAMLSYLTEACGSCWLGCVTTEESRSFGVFPSSPLGRFTLRLVTQWPLKVIPYTTHEMFRLLSMPITPFGSTNYIKRIPDGSYEHTFYNLSADIYAGLAWLRE